MTLCTRIKRRYAECHKSECRIFLLICWVSYILYVMLDVVMLSVIVLNVVKLSVIMLSVIMLIVFMQSVTIHNVLMNCVVMLNAVMLSVIMLNINMLSALAPVNNTNLKLHSADPLVEANSRSLSVFKYGKTYCYNIALGYFVLTHNYI